jgi:hypothetical protein
VLDVRNRVRAHGAPRERQARVRGRASGGRMVAGVARIGNTVTAAIVSRRVLEPVEAHIALIAGGLLMTLAVLAIVYPRGFAYPVAVIAAYLAAALLYRGIALYVARKRRL